jgi:multidrug efflux pump subunit AcrA (membrane-fusion protein)
MAENEEKSAGRLVLIVGITALATCLILICLVLFARHRELTREFTSRKAGINAGARVQVALATSSPREQILTLTGEARPFASVTLYAKVSGYLKKIMVDKGDTVKRGELLALIDSPELEN